MKDNKIFIKKRSGLFIPNIYENDFFYTQLKTHLTRKMRNFQTKEITIKEFFSEDETGLLIPRFTPINKIINRSLNEDFNIDISIENELSDGDDIEITHNIELRDNTQLEALNFMRNSESGIIKLKPGSGKTVISIYFIAEFHKRTLIIAHRDSLIDQWIERLLHFTNLKKKDIMRISNRSLKNIKKNKSILITHPSAFTWQLNNNKERFLRLLNEANIGLFIADEVHTSVGAPTFSDCSLFVPTKRIYGLSATPYRFDGNSDIIEYHLGEIFSMSESSGTMKPEVRVILIDLEIEKNKKKYIYWGGEFSYPKYYKLLSRSKKLIWLLESLLLSFLKTRSIFLLAYRIEILNYLNSFLEKNDFTDKIIFKSGVKYDDAKDKKIVLSTPGKSRDGIDFREKDLLIMTAPISNIEQVVGRITREYPNKRTPIIIDIVDIGSQKISQSFEYRLKFYEKEMYKVRFLEVKNINSKKDISKDEALKILNS